MDELNQIELISTSKLRKNPKNPRVLKDHKFKQLVKSIQDFPEMLKIRPIVVNSDNIVLGGNMRLSACREAKIKQVPVLRVENLTPEQQEEFIIKDNVGFGEWDWDMLANEWDSEKLEEWGLDLPMYDAPVEDIEEPEDKSVTIKVTIDQEYLDIEGELRTEIAELLKKYNGVTLK